MIENSFYLKDELLILGFKRIGKGCLISRFARFYSIHHIEIGDFVRIDDFCILSGRIVLGSYIHISSYCALYGSKGITINDFSGMSPKSVIYSATDDFSGNYLINPMVPDQYTNVTGGKVEIGKYVQLGGNTIVLPNIKINEGVVTGVFTMVHSNLEEWNIYVGIPARIHKKRKKELQKYVKEIEKQGR